jgi:virginiamycin A acetyltransferase
MTPDPMQVFPLPAQHKVVFLKPVVEDELIEIGEYTYYDDIDHSTEFADRNVLYKFGPERLIIGRYCAIATGVRFIMSGGNHPMVGVGTYPFCMFYGEWGDVTDEIVPRLPSRGDTVVGHNVWIGLNAIILPGVHIGDGSIIGAGAVVSHDVPPYGIAVGNPARVVKKRFSDEEIAMLLRAAWWHWPIEKVTKHALTIMEGSPAEVAALA